MHNSDKLIKEQAILRHKEKEARRKQDFPIHRGDGNVCVGSIFDCSRKSFERVLKDYSSDLYVGWNPLKNEGRGCWEVWHRPRRKTPVYQGIHEGNKIYTLEYKPNDFEHHVYDLQYLRYDFIEDLRRMDMWANKQFISQMDDRLDEDQDKLDAKEEESIRYAVRHNKSLFGKLKGLAQDGYNPFWFFSDKRQGDGEV